MSGRGIGNATQRRKPRSTGRGGESEELRSLEEGVVRIAWKVRQGDARRGGEILRERRAVWEVVTTSLHADVSLDSENVTNERPLLLHLNGWWAWLRAPEVNQWQERHSVEWDAIDGRKRRCKAYCLGDAARN